MGSLRASILILVSCVCLSACSRARASAREEIPAQGDGVFLSLPSREAFTVDDRLRKNVDFWIRIYSYYGINQGLIHDAKYVDIIYEIVNIDNPGSRSSVRKIKRLKKKWHDLLITLHHKQRHPETMTDEEKRVFQMFLQDHEPNKFLKAASRKRLRFQEGMKEHFLEGLRMSGRYLPVMEDIFRKEGLPVELTRLPFVESSFNVHARSKVGASGIWQFMRSTGRLYLKINDAIDERNDPVLATEAAARLLRDNYASLGTWPLAVTAYNHGRKGMMRAVRMVGSEDLEDVVEDYRSRSFGFASSNFFTELLAAIEVEKNADKYFGNIERDKPVKYYEVPILRYIDVRQLADFLKLDMNQLKDLNPALTERVWSGRRRIPAGYPLRLPLPNGLSPEAAAHVFLAGFDEIPAMYKFDRQTYGGSRHRTWRRTWKKRYGKR